MRYGIQLLGRRVAPRYAAAETIRLVTMRRGFVAAQAEVPAVGHSWVDLFNLLAEHQVDALVCGGIDIASRESLTAGGITVIDNVACTADEVVAALAGGTLCSGYGFQRSPAGPVEKGGLLVDTGIDVDGGIADCLACREKVCLGGGRCPLAGQPETVAPAGEVTSMLDAAADISCEDERFLCRLSELVYFCLEMNYRRIGVAFCVELQEPTEILVGALKRFFQVFAVGCKVGGHRLDEPPDMSGGQGPALFSGIACNPLGQARVLNRQCCDLNVLVGLCVGTDSVFVRASEAPVTTFIVKDRSLAHNPIGALYSEYYLSETSRADPVKVRTTGEVDGYRHQ